MALESITLRNFQAHAKLTVKFDERITVIVAPTDAGKSAVIRALRWACRNKPNGEDFIRHGEKEAKVVLRFDGGRKVVRSRGGRKNSYSLDGSEFSAFGNNVPERIADALKLADINIQMQHDSPYWFGESEGQVSKKLNELVNLGIIDRTLAATGSAVRSARAERELIVKRLDEAKASVRSLKGIEKTDAALLKVEGLWEELSSVRKRRERLSGDMDVLRTAVGVRKRHKALIAEGEAVVALGDKLKAIGTRRDALESSLRLLARLDRERAMEVPSLVELTKTHLALDLVRGRRVRLSDAIEELRTLWKKRKHAQDALALAEKELEENTPETCPTCGAAWKKGHSHG